MEKISIPDGATLFAFTDKQIRTAARRPENRVKRWLRRVWERQFPFSVTEVELNIRRRYFPQAFSPESIGAKITARHTF